MLVAALVQTTLVYHVHIIRVPMSLAEQDLAIVRAAKH
jgi:hypothetical protein